MGATLCAPKKKKTVSFELDSEDEHFSKIFGFFTFFSKKQYIRIENYSTL